MAEFAPAEYALGAGSWRARDWLGRPAQLIEGVPADLVVFDADPRLDLGVLRTPRLVVLRGRRSPVSGQPARTGAGRRLRSRSWPP